MMTELLYILSEISLPIILLIVTGFAFQKIFKTDVRSFTKLLIYVLVPVVIFVKIINTDFTWDLFLIVVAFVMLLQAAMYVISRVVGRLFKYPKSMRNATTNALTLFNTGNYGIPLIDLVFAGNPLAMASQIFVVVVQNITTNTFGVYQVSTGNGSGKKALKNIAKLPSNYIIVLAAIVKLTEFKIPDTLMVPLDYMADAFVAMALIALGIQLADVRFGQGAVKRALGIGILKVVAAPVLGFLFVLLLGVKGVLAQALVIGISTPTAVNSAVLAREFNNEPAFAAQVVVVTTAICTLTLPIVIGLARLLFAV